MESSFRGQKEGPLFFTRKQDFKATPIKESSSAAASAVRSALIKEERSKRNLEVALEKFQLEQTPTTTRTSARGLVAEQTRRSLAAKSVLERGKRAAAKAAAARAKAMSEVARKLEGTSIKDLLAEAEAKKKADEAVAAAVAASQQAAASRAKAAAAEKELADMMTRFGAMGGGKKRSSHRK